MSDVATLLRDSMAAHDAAKQARANKQPDREALALAQQLRQQAHLADPTHSDPAWIEEQHRTPSTDDTHAALMTFYEQRLGR